MAAVHVSRASDDRVLAMITLRCRGQASDVIAARFGMKGPDVRIVTNRVKNADVAESGEDRVVVLGAYWG
jgi:hypothetical protein